MNEVAKTQQIRLFDVFLIGPYLVWLAARSRPPHREILFGLGVLTILYNGQNYLRNADSN